MELAALVVAIVAAILGTAAIVISCWNTIHIQAQRLSTHTVIPVSPQQTTIGKLEDELERIAKAAGADQNDLNATMLRAGLDPDELV